MNKILGMCFNWKVVTGLAIMALAVGIAAPKLLLVALPLLLVAVCPLSMLFMMRSMNQNQNTQRDQQAVRETEETRF